MAQKNKIRIFMKNFWLAAFTVTAVLISCAQNNNQNLKMNTTKESEKTEPTFTGKPDTATFGTGCFWCTEAIFEQLDGVISATSGYAGGHVSNPSYKDVCTGETGHAECIQIVYDTSKISFDELLEVFWQVHDPTTLNRQGADVGTQYRSVIFYHDNEQKQKAEKYKTDLDKSGAFDNPIVTTLEPFAKFYTAENYHQEYYELNKNSNPYCSIVIRPKLEKFEKVFKHKLKKH
jgi:peptide-methionine (S)-S-oxide reductase